MPYASNTLGATCQSEQLHTPGNQAPKLSCAYLKLSVFPGGQNVFKGANNGMPNGAYTGYPAQPMPVQGYPAGEPFLAPRRRGSCCNVQWVCHSHCIMQMEGSYNQKAPQD